MRCLSSYRRQTFAETYAPARVAGNISALMCGDSKVFIALPGATLLLQCVNIWYLFKSVEFAPKLDLHLNWNYITERKRNQKRLWFSLGDRGEVAVEVYVTKGVVLWLETLQDEKFPSIWTIKEDAIPICFSNVLYTPPSAEFIIISNTLCSVAQCSCVPSLSQCSGT